MTYAKALREVLSPINNQRMFYEIVIAPGADPEALDHLAKKSKDLRILTAPLGKPHRPRIDLRVMRGGVVVQDADVSQDINFQVVTNRQPSETELIDMGISWIVCKHVKSNAITFVKNGVLIGMGAGQPNRVGSARLSGEAAGQNAHGAVAASDALLPFPDTVNVCAEFGVTCIVHTGGSLRDQEVIETADRLGIAMVFTGVRHFRH